MTFSYELKMCKWVRNPYPEVLTHFITHPFPLKQYPLVAKCGYIGQLELAAFTLKFGVRPQA
jgi:hypothetical protein